MVQWLRISPAVQGMWVRSLVGAFALGHGVSFLVGANILQLMVVQQRIVVLEFSQEKMSACPSTLPSSRDVSQLLAMAELVLDGVWGLLMHTRFCLSPLSVSGGYGV